MENNQPPPSRTAAEVLKGPPPQTFPFNPEIKFGSIDRSEASPTISFSNEEIQTLSIPFRHSLIGKFSHGLPTFNAFSSFLENLKLKGDFSLKKLNSKHILIMLNSADDFSTLWMRREWSVNGFPMRTFKWEPDFDLKTESSVVPVWVRFLDLPLHLFHHGALFSLGQAIGAPLKMDAATAKRTRISYARICVEVDLLSKLPDEVVVQFKEQQVKISLAYENLPLFCTHCRHLGHAVETCYIKGNGPRPSARRRLPTKVANGSSVQGVEEKSVPNVASNIAHNVLDDLHKPVAQGPHKDQTPTALADANSNSRGSIPEAANSALNPAALPFHVKAASSTVQNQLVPIDAPPTRSRDKGKAPVVPNTGAEVHNSFSSLQHDARASELPVVPFNNPSPIDVMFPPFVIDGAEEPSHCESGEIDANIAKHASESSYWNSMHLSTLFDEDVDSSNNKKVRISFPKTDPKKESAEKMDENEIFEEARTSQNIQRSISLDKIDVNVESSLFKKKKTKKSKKAKPSTPHID